MPKRINLIHVVAGFILQTSIALAVEPVSAGSALEFPSPPIPLVHDGQPACTIVLAADAADGWLMQQSAAAIDGTVERWSGVKLPVRKASSDASGVLDKPAIIIGTLEGLSKYLPKLPTPYIRALDRVRFIDEQGFMCMPVNLARASTMAGHASHVLVVGRTPRGAYNGAIWLRDFCIDGTKENLELTQAPTVRTPQLPGRAVYTLTIWGHEAEYTAADWEKIFDSFARDGFDRVYFWVSGHFPSKKFPQTVKCKDNGWDTTEKSRIATVEDLQRIIRAAHDRGLKFYAGGALGGWCCTCMLTNHAPGTTKTAKKGSQYAGETSLCPSHPASRKALIDYYKEVFDGLPEADGLFIESADEWGGCFCPTCSRKVDDLGSTQFGQSQITLVQEIMHAVWQNHPHARLSYTIGYAEHKKDLAYYELVRQMSDPRIEWMEPRNSWTFPGPGGEDLPASTFSRQIMRWQQYYGCPLDQLVKDAARVGQSCLFGLITAFEPGAGTGSFYTQIPYPTDIMPYILTGFVWREATWSPAPTVQSMRDRVQRRFFGYEAASTLSEDLWDLRELIREASGSRKQKPALLEKVMLIEKHVQQARASASPKTAETLDLMTKAIADIRSHTK